MTDLRSLGFQAFLLSEGRRGHEAQLQPDPGRYIGIRAQGAEAWKEFCRGWTEAREWTLYGNPEVSA